MPAKMTVSEQLDKWVYRDPNSGCWLWLGSVCQDGYAKTNNRAYPGQSLGHRLSYLYHVGPIPDDCEIDHVCRVRSCVNPAHLEAVPHEENCKRGDYKSGHRNTKKTHCIRGHEFTKENIRVEIYNGVRMRKCKICNLAKNKRKYEKAKLVKAVHGITIKEM